MKTYAYAIENTGCVIVSTLDENDPEVQEAQIFKELSDGESTLALRYAVKDGSIVDAYLGKTDDEVLASLLVAPTADPVNDLVLAKKAKLLQIRTHFNNAVEGIKKDVAPYEVATWDVQRIEYAEWLKDKTAAIPYITALAAGRQIEIPLLMEKIGYRVAALATVQGIQQALEGQVEACATIDEVNAIELPVLG